MDRQTSSYFVLLDRNYREHFHPNISCYFRTSEDIVYTIEELLAMIFSHAKNQAEVYADQKIKVPSNIWG